jgi:hypothetical protein
MKKILISVLTALLSSTVFVGSPEFHDAMLENIKSIDTTKKYSDFIALAGTFEQIASVEKSEWLPKYYAAFCYIQASFGIPDEDKKDVMANKAIEIADNALKLRPTESELYTLIGFANIAKLSAKPMLRGMTYSSKIKDFLVKACELDSKNPRPVYLLGTLTYNTPEFAGGGKEKAMTQLKDALTKFNEFVPVNDLSPLWGKKGCEYYINKK